jgi:hypothetical protein
METIQLAISNSAYAAALRESLMRDSGWHVETVETPNPGAEGVLVLDSTALERIPGGIPHPERAVLVARNEPELLARAWEAGIVSVVFENDPINTAMLAIMAARLHKRKDAAASVAEPGSQTVLRRK